MNIEMKLKGEYQCVLNQGTDREVSTGWMPNLVTDYGLDRLGISSYGNPLLATLAIGTGSSTPVASNTALDALSAYTTNRTSINESTGTSPYAGIVDAVYAFSVGDVVGNMTELGVGADQTHLFSRALIVDGAGSPTSLTVTITDQLTVYYRLSVIPSTSDYTGTVVISGTTYTYTARSSNVGSFRAAFDGGTWGVPQSAGSSRLFSADMSLGAITGDPSAGQGDNFSSISTATYVSGNYYKDTTFSASTSVAVFTSGGGGIGGFYLNFQGGGQQRWQYLFTSPIPKDATMTFSITARYVWGR